MKRILMFSLLLSVCSLQLNSIPNGNKHIVRKGETLYALAKKYKVTVSELAKTNSISSRTEIKTGQILVVPGLKSTATVRNYKPVTVPSTPDTPYREEDVRPRTTLYIPRDRTAEEPQELFAEPKPVVTEGLRTNSSDAAEYPAIFNQYSMNGYFMKKKNGTANYLSDATSGNQNLAFYSDAETGSVIRVTNLMNHKTIFVKVVGKVPPVDAGNEIVVKLSNKAALDLEATDEKFLVEVASFYQE